jgi:Grx4 family monothiol glutaredoxin
VVFFMKGTPTEPRCKFSRAAVAKLAEAGVTYTAFDILGDEAVRAGLKEFGGQSTYPQLWVGGKLAGGGDAITRMAEEGTLAKALAPHTVDVSAPGKPSAHVRCESLVKSSPVMLFMKGNPEAPRCGFSARTVELLRGQQIEFGTFDILSDPEVRQGLKECCGKWPTFPQLFVNGEFVGGLDILNEMVEDGDEPLREQLGLE